MVISMTSAVLTNTHDVSPEFTADAAAAGAGVAATAAAAVVATSSARAGNAPAIAIPAPIHPVNRPNLFTCFLLSLVVVASKSISIMVFPNTTIRAK
jgi:hypothetical protein